MTSMKAASISKARAARAKAAELLGDSKLVNGIGIAREAKGYAVKVNLVKVPRDGSLPAEIDGVPVRVEVVGRIKKQPLSTNSSRRRRSA